MTQFKFGAKSLKELQGVHPDLVSVVHRSLELSPIDFAVHDGLRTDVEQLQLFRAGASQLDGRTKRSEHQVQETGFGHAVDLVPYINGKLRWEWEPIYLIADAVREAAEEQSVRIRWGGHWGELTGTGEVPTGHLVEAYVNSRRAKGLKAFIDGPHYEVIL